jgi:hypothetical protein
MFLFLHLLLEKSSVQQLMQQKKHTEKALLKQLLLVTNR